LRGAGGSGGGRSDGRPRARRRARREVRRRLGRRARRQLDGVPRSNVGAVRSPVIRPILKYGESTLHGQARPIDALTPEIDRLIEDMIETMYAAPGVGLAAPQVGVPLRAFVIDLSIGREANGLIVMINPEVVEMDGVQLEEEGCLSIPGFNAT